MEVLKKGLNLMMGLTLLIGANEKRKKYSKQFNVEINNLVRH
jgi:hypothetical protein